MRIAIAVLVATLVACGGGSDPGSAPSSPPAPPTGLSAIPATTTSIEVAWNDQSADETGFEVQREGPQGFVTIATPGAGTASFVDTGLLDGVTYAYRVRAVGAGGASAWTAVATATTSAGTAPVAPADVAAVALSSSDMRITWTDASWNEAGFEIERALGNGAFSLAATAGPGATACQISGLTHATDYRFRVRATNAIGSSTWSAPAAARTLDLPPASPAALLATAAGPFRIDLAWTDASANEAGFQVEWAASAGGPWTVLGDSAAGVPALSAVNLAPGTTYHFRVRAFGEGGFSGYSNAAAETTDHYAEVEATRDVTVSDQLGVGDETYASGPLYVGDVWASSGGSRWAALYRAVLAFDVDFLSGMTVRSATLTLAVASPAVTTSPAYAYACGRLAGGPWTDSVTYLQTQIWGVYSPLAMTFPSEGWATADLTAGAQIWADGASPNNGVMCYESTTPPGDTAANHVTTLHSVESAPAPELRPRLVVEYR